MGYAFACACKQPAGTVIHANFRWSQSVFGLAESLGHETDLHSFLTQRSAGSSGFNAGVCRDISHAMVDEDAWVVFDIGPVDVHARIYCRRALHATANIEAFVNAWILYWVWSEIDSDGSVDSADVAVFFERAAE